MPKYAFRAAALAAGIVAFGPHGATLVDIREPSHMLSLLTVLSVITWAMRQQVDDADEHDD